MKRSDGTSSRRWRRLGGVVVVPNVILLAIAAPALTLSRVVEHRIGPLVVTDQQTRARIAQLERSLKERPADRRGAIELARLYQRTGELPWSYDALRRLEQGGLRDAGTRLAVGTAYLEIGKNEDGLRVLTGALGACEIERCSAGVASRLSIMQRVAELFLERGIDARQEYRRVDAVWREVLKPVKPPLIRGSETGRQQAEARDGRIQ